MVGLDLVQAPDPPNREAVPGPIRLEHDLAFGKDAAAMALMEWSKMNSELYNFHMMSGPTPTSC